jgi:hypothetical protein
MSYVTNSVLDEYIFDSKRWLLFKKTILQTLLKTNVLTELVLHNIRPT